jgi:pyruvate dehydrogenase E1 component alpha subunit
MILIRQFEERAFSEYSMPRDLPGGRHEAKIGGFMHLCNGQEAIAAGIAEVFRPSVDALVCGHRCHGYALALGVPTRRVMAELYGRAAGCCGGRAGSMGLVDASVGFLGAFAVAGAQVPVGIGAAFASRYRGDGGCAFILFGDGALEQGAVNEAMNLAALLRLPAIFILEDNGVACGTKVERHSAEPDLVKRGSGYGMPYRGFDGNDIEQVVAQVGEAAALARAGGGPTYLVARTFRLRGFMMTDPMRYRTREEMNEALAREPIGTYVRSPIQRGLIDEEGFWRLIAEADALIDDAVSFAEGSADPAIETRFDDVVGSRH